MKLDELCKIIEEGSAIRKWSCLMLDMSFLSEEMAELHESICPCDVYDDEPGHGIELHPHCTVKYGIHPEYTPYDIYHGVDLYPVKVKIGKLSLFENDNYDVLKFNIISKDLCDINEQVSRVFNCTDSYHKYNPHITVAYIKPGTGKYYIDMDNDISGQLLIGNKYIFSNPMSEKVEWIVD